MVLLVPSTSASDESREGGRRGPLSFCPGCGFWPTKMASARQPVDFAAMQSPTISLMFNPPSPGKRFTSAASSNPMEGPLLAAQAGTDVEASLDGSDSDALSSHDAALGLINAMIGLSVLSLPYAFHLIGNSLGLLTLSLIVSLMAHTGGLIGAALRLAARIPELAAVPPGHRDFAFLAQAAFGEKGRSFVGIVTAFEVWFALVTFMAFNIVNSEFLVPQLDRSLCMALSCGLAVGAALLPARAFAYVSFASFLAVLATGVAVFAACMPSLLSMDWSKGGARDAGRPDELHNGIWVSSEWMVNLPRAIGIIVFCFAGHPCFPVVHESLRDRGDWSRAINNAFTASLVYYISFACTGSLAFGQNVQPSVVQNLATLPGPVADHWRRLAGLAILIKVQLTAPLLLNTIIVAVGPSQTGKQQGVQAASWEFVQRVVPLALLATFTGCIALAFAHNVAALASLTGSLLVMITSVLFPIVVYRRLSKMLGQRESFGRSLVHSALVALALLIAVTGTTQAANDLWKR